MVFYEITAAPEEYQEMIGSAVYVYLSRNKDETSIKAAFTYPHEKEIMDRLNRGDFELSRYYDGLLHPLLPSDTLKSTFSKEQQDWVWDYLNRNYIGFAEIQEKGFTEEAFYRANDSVSLTELLDSCLNDTHFYLWIDDFVYTQTRAHDEGAVKSLDEYELYYEIETSNAYYFRITGCTNADYYAGFQFACVKASRKDFIVIDARTNSGGDNTPQVFFSQFLEKNNYPGTVIVLQDNWSASAGECWDSFGKDWFHYKRVLVGTHSGGYQRFDCNTYTNDELGILLACGGKNWDDDLPSNYLGEGKGYEPDIWAVTPDDFRTVLEDLGVDLTGIILQ